MNNYDTDSLVRVQELNEDRLCPWLVMGSVTSVRDDLDGAVEYVKALRKVIRAERPN